MDDRKKYYIRKYWHRQALYLLFLWGFMIAVNIFDGFHDLSIFFLFFLILSGNFFLISYQSVRRFSRMIRLQEEMFGIQFSDTDAMQFSKYSLNYVSKDWFIQSGSYAFYRGYITSVSHKFSMFGRRQGGRYRIAVQTSDGMTYRFWLRTAADVDIFLTWSGHDD